MRSLELFGLLAVFIAGTAAASANPCEGILYGILVNPAVCYKFFVCYKGETEEITCPEGTIFSVDEIECIPGNQKTCVEGFPEEDVEDNPCRGIVLGRLPHPDSCTKYNRCVLGRIQEQTCREGFIFSERTFLCLPGDSQTCEVYQLPTTTTPAPGTIKPIPADFCLANGKLFGRLPHPQLCTRFVRCRLMIPEERECPSWMVFNEEISLCLPGNPNTCATIAGPGASTIAPIVPDPPISEDICEGKTLALITHPYRCYKYVLCVNGDAIERECPVYHVFSNKNSLCLPGNRETCTVFGEKDD